MTERLFYPIFNGKPFDIFHSLMSNVLVVLMLRMSSTISSAVRLSSHIPQKRSAQCAELLLALWRLIERLSMMMSSNFILSLSSSNSGQYRAIMGDDVFTTLFSIIQHSRFVVAKINKNFDTVIIK